MRIPRFVSHIYRNSHDIAVMSCLYDGPNKALYEGNMDGFVGSHLRYCQDIGYDYWAFNNRLLDADRFDGLLHQHHIDWSVHHVTFGLYKWIAALYLTRIIGYKAVVVIDYDTTFFKHEPFPEEMLDYKLGVTNSHAWSQVNAPSVFFFDRWLGIDSLSYEYWYNTGMFYVRNDFEYEPFLREFVDETIAILDAEPFAMNEYDANGHDCLFKANDEIFCQLLINKTGVEPYRFDNNKWNTGDDNASTVLRHYTDKHNIPR